MGCLAISVQIIALFAFLYYFVNPKFAVLEKTLVEKNLHRGLELLQRELFHLERLSQLLAQESLISQLVNNNASEAIPKDKLQSDMLSLEINLICILDENRKVVWEQILDLSTERPYPKQSIVTSLWEKKPAFLEHTSKLSIQSGIFNSKLGPMLVVSAPIPSTNNLQVAGTLITGKLITQDVIHLIQSLSYTDVKLWPLGGSSLSPKQIAIIQKLQKSDSDYRIEQSGDTFRGYMMLQDLNQQPNLLISTTQPREITKIIALSLSEGAVIFLALQVLFLIALYFLIRATLLIPARQLILQLNTRSKDWRPIHIDAKPWNEMGLLATTISNVISRYQDQLSHETTLAYREGCYQTRHTLIQEMEDTLKPVIEGIELTEKKLSNLPTNDLEWIIAESKTGKLSAKSITDFGEKLQIINEKLRLFQKETRHRFYDLYSKTLRNAASIRAESRSLDTVREFTPIKPKDKIPITRS
jgi:sensor domain CHASE-containing protein